MNSHIEVNKIDTITANEFSISKYDEMVRFRQWLDEQKVRFDNGRHALKVYRGKEEAPAATGQQIINEPRYTEKSFKSRQQLNSFLRRNGYTWHKIAPMGEVEESQYNESYRWQLYSADDRAVTVEQALSEIG